MLRSLDRPTDTTRTAGATDRLRPQARPGHLNWVEGVRKRRGHGCPRAHRIVALICFDAIKGLGNFISMRFSFSGKICLADLDPHCIAGASNQSQKGIQPNPSQSCSYSRKHCTFDHFCRTSGT